MVACAYCEHPLICDHCRTEYLPPSPEAYEALSRAEAVILCPCCEQVVVCHWCKTPFDGTAPDERQGPTG